MYVSTAKDPIQDGLFKNNGILDLAIEIDDYIKNKEIMTNLHGIIQFKDVCAKSRGSKGEKCQNNDFLELNNYSVMKKIRSGKANMTFPLFKDPISGKKLFTPAFFGNITTLYLQDRDLYIIKEVTSIRLTFILDSHGQNKNVKEKKMKADIWERTILGIFLKILDKK